jgi:hypothetical protein
MIYTILCLFPPVSGKPAFGGLAGNKRSFKVVVSVQLLGAMGMKYQIRRMAIFRTEAGFKITGRGFVIAGDIIEGTISAGNSIFTHELEPINGKVIKSVESIRAKTATIGLIISYRTDAELEELKGLNFQQRQIEIKE